MKSLHVRWTAHAASYVVLGVVLLAVGARVQTASLVALGGTLLLLVSWDALRLQVRPPRVSLDLRPQRVAEDGTVLVRLSGTDLHPHHQVHVDLSAGLLLGEGTNLWHPGIRGEASHRFLLKAPVRGPQRVGPATVRNWSPTRLWARDQVIARESTVEVVPRAENVEQFAVLSRVVKPMQGRFDVNRPGHGFDFFTLRQYQSGDTIRSVNWKASARRDEDLIVNQRQMETHSEMVILLDARVTAGTGPIGHTPLDRGCRAALGIFTDATAHRDTVHFLAYGEGTVPLPPARSDRVTALESLLARLPAAGDTPLQQAWETVRRDVKSRGPIVVVTSAEADSTAAPTVANMLGRGHPVTVLCPTPTGLAWRVDAKRREARKDILDTMRDRGAIVVDWKPGTQVMAEKPAAPGAGH